MEHVAETFAALRNQRIVYTAAAWLSHVTAVQLLTI